MTECPGGRDCTCGCCAGVESATPRPLDNRVGLARIAYRTGTHPDFLASMLAGLTDADRPALAALTTREPGDPTIGLLDAWAVAADVLTFHTERQAHEAFLRTAVDRSSLTELGRLIGYRLRPGVAAETLLVFAVEPPPEPPPLPAGTASQPGAMPPVVPEVVDVPSGLRVQSIPGPDEKPQTFETMESVEARAEWGAIPASTTVEGIEPTEAWLEGSSLGLAAGDLLVWLGGSQPRARVLDAVEPDDATGRTKVSWAGGVGDLGSDPTPIRFRKRLAVFGHQAPQWKAMSDDFRSDYDSTVPAVGDWPGLDVDIDDGAELALEGSHPDIVSGSHVAVTAPALFLVIVPGLVESGPPGLASPGVAGPEIPIGELEVTGGEGVSVEPLAAPSVDPDGPAVEVVGMASTTTGSPSVSTALWTVAEVTEGSAAEFALSGKVTRVELDGTADLGAPSRRDVVVHAVSEKLTVANRDDTNVVAGSVVEVDTDVSAMSEGRRIIVSGATAAGADVVHSAAVTAVTEVDGRWKLEFEPALPSGTSLERDTVVVHANVVLAGHGESTSELLGSGRADTAHQRFTLSASPLTHEQSTDASGAEAALEVWVDDQRWSETGTLYDAGATDREYVLRTDPAGRDEVRFGDGHRGARLPTGRQNVRARYRTGLGSAGNVGAGSLANLLDRPLGLKGVENPAPGTGGVDPEPADEACTAMPLPVRTLDRAVSLLDYEDYARTFAGVSKASASVLTLRGGPTVVVTVAFGKEGTDPVGDRLADLASSLVDHGDPLVSVEVLDHTRTEFRLSAGVAVDDTYDPDDVVDDVRDAVDAAFAFRRRRFGQPVTPSEVVAVIHAVSGVVAVDLDHLYAGSAAAAAPKRLLAPSASVVAGTAQPAGILVAGADPFDLLEEMT